MSSLCCSQGYGQTTRLTTFQAVPRLVHEIDLRDTLFSDLGVSSPLMKVDEIKRALNSEFPPKFIND